MGRAEWSGHLFTVDVEEYFQVHAFESFIQRGEWTALPSRVERATETLLAFLDGTDTRATFFVLGWIAERFPGLVRRIADGGHEVASHGWWHRKLTELEPEEFREDVRGTKRFLEDVTGRNVFGFRAPGFSLVPGCEWAFDILLEEGYRYDASVLPARRPGSCYPGALAEPHLIARPAGTILELPVTTLEWAGLRVPVAGGAYFRHFPYGVTRKALEALRDRGIAGVFYVHPWEVDPEQPRFPASFLTRVRHYRNLELTLPRLGNLSRDFAFTSIEEHYRLDSGENGTSPAPDREPGLRVLEDGLAG